MDPLSRSAQDGYDVPMGHKRWWALGFFLLAGSVTAESHACGGLFCSRSTPVNQAAERIIFSKNADDTITAVIEIQYEGRADEFSWVLPIPGVPEIGVSSTSALDKLQQATNPVYQLTTRRLSCPMTSTPDTLWLADAPEVLDASAPGGVHVALNGSVGPYDYDVITVLGDPDDPAELALKWLEDNGYDVSQLGEEVLGVYLSQGMNLVAFRLSKDANVGSIRPVTITYDAQSASIPIRPTAVAAKPGHGRFGVGDWRTPSGSRELPELGAQRAAHRLVQPFRQLRQSRQRCR